METSKVLNLILAVALVVLSVKITFLDSDKGGGAANGECDTAQIVLDNIMTRTSIRDYTQQKVEKEKIETILRAGMAAPTARNCQPWSFVVIDNEEMLQKLPDIYLIASGGVSRVDDIVSLDELGVQGVIFGKAIYEGRIALRDLRRFL